MTLNKTCAITGCGKPVKVEASEYSPDRFVLCLDCETAIVLDCHMAMEQMGEIPKKATAMFAVPFNAFRRKRKGASLTHKSGLVTTLKELKEQLIVL
jgi:hypothetical protein